MRMGTESKSRQPSIESSITSRLSTGCPSAKVTAREPEFVEAEVRIPWSSSLDRPGRRKAPGGAMYAHARAGRCSIARPTRAAGRGRIMLDNTGNCYLRTKGALVRAGQTMPLRCKASGTTCSAFHFCGGCDASTMLTARWCRNSSNSPIRNHFHRRSFRLCRPA